MGHLEQQLRYVIHSILKYIYSNMRIGYVKC